MSGSASSIPRGLISEFVRSQDATDEIDACRRAVAKHFGATSEKGPSDLAALARSKGIGVTRAHGLSFEGVIERAENGSAAITLRAGLNSRRERFTLAHELGHWLLQEEMLGTVAGKLFRGLARNSSEVRDEERLANLLAAEILLPVDALQKLFDRDARLASLLDICRKLRVSRTMAVRRIADVCEQAIVLLQLVPYMFKRVDSLAEVDDAIFATARCATLFDRTHTKLVDRVPYGEIAADSERVLHLRSPKGQIVVAFELDHRPTPIPHTFALACLDGWPMEVGTLK